MHAYSMYTCIPKLIYTYIGIDKHIYIYMESHAWLSTHMCMEGMRFILSNLAASQLHAISAQST